VNSSNSLEIIVADVSTEEARVKQVVQQAREESDSLFIGRFLTDLCFSEADERMEQGPSIVVRQYGNSCWVNASSNLADAYRAELGLEEARDAVVSGRYSTVYLSQVLNTVAEDLLAAADLKELIELCPAHLRLVMTGDHLPAGFAESTAPQRGHCSTETAVNTLSEFPPP